MGTAEIIEQQTVYSGWYRLSRLTVRMPNGAVVERHLLDNGSATAVLPYDPLRRTCILIEQPRAAVLHARETNLLEAVAGNLEGARAEERIVQEAMEEAGLALASIEPVSNIWPLCPVSTERVQLFLAAYSEKDRIGVGGGAPDEDENIVVHEIGLDRLKELVLAGELTDAKTLILAQALMLRHPELWA